MTRMNRLCNISKTKFTGTVSKTLRNINWRLQLTQHATKIIPEKTKPKYRHCIKASNYWNQCLLLKRGEKLKATERVLAKRTVVIKNLTRTTKTTTTATITLTTTLTPITKKQCKQQSCKKARNHLVMRQNAKRTVPERSATLEMLHQIDPLLETEDRQDVSCPTIWHPKQWMWEFSGSSSTCKLKMPRLDCGAAIYRPETTWTILPPISEVFWQQHPNTSKIT